MLVAHMVCEEDEVATGTEVGSRASDIETYGSVVAILD